MNRTEIEAKWNTLTARERDAWVAEVVFGLSIGRERRINGDIFISEPNAPHGFQRLAPKYTTDISAAWSVATEFPIHNAGLDSHVAEYQARVGQGDGGVGMRVSYAYAPTAPEAICLAAIIAKLT